MSDIATVNTEVQQYLEDYIERFFVANADRLLTSPGDAIRVSLNVIRTKFGEFNSKGQFFSTLPATQALIRAWEIARPVPETAMSFLTGDFLTPSKIPLNYDPTKHARMTVATEYAPFNAVIDTSQEASLTSIWNIDAFDMINDLMNKCWTENTKSNPALFLTGVRKRKRSMVTKAYSAFATNFLGSPEHTGANCRCCRDFIHHYGSLVCVDAEGKKTSALWDPTLVDVSSYPEQLVAFFHSMADYVAKETIRDVLTADTVGAYASSDAGDGGDGSVIAGFPSKGNFPHLSIVIYKELYASIAPSQFGFLNGYMAAITHVKSVVEEYSADSIATAISSLRGHAHLEKFIGSDGLEWWRKATALNWVPSNAEAWLHLTKLTHPTVLNLRTKAVGNFIRMLNRQDPDALKKFYSSVDPVNYKRAEAQASAAAMEKVLDYFQSEGIMPSFSRRYASLSDVLHYLRSVWVAPVTPTVVPPSVTPSAAHDAFRNMLSDARAAAESTPKASADTSRRFLDIPPVTVSARKFFSTYLPKASRVYVLQSVDGRNAAYFIATITTAVDPDAPPILKHDSLTQRNPLCSVGLDPRPARADKYYAAHGVTTSEPIPVTAIVLAMGDHLWFTLEGVHPPKEISERTSGLFPDEFIARYQDTSDKRKVISELDRRLKLAETPVSREQAACVVLLQMKATHAHLYIGLDMVDGTRMRIALTGNDD